MTRYEWSQRMRACETAVRREKDAQYLAEAAGDKTLKSKCRQNINALQEKYKGICEATGLKTQYERMRGTGNAETGKSSKALDLRPNKSYNDQKPFKMNLQLFAEKDIEKQNASSLRKGIIKLRGEIEDHKRKIENPDQFCPEWSEYSEKRKNGLLKHWLKEISNFEESIQNREYELKRREKHD